MSLAGGRSSVVGRERELTIVDDFLDPAIERCRVLVMEGVPGIGKTTVWREAIRRAREQGFRVLSCRPSELEAAFAAAAVADLLEEIPDGALGSLPAPQQRAIQVALMHAEPEKQQIEARAVPAAFRSLLELLGREGNLLVAVDDEQWLDTASATTIGFALRRLTDTPIRWLITHRLGSSYALDIERLTEPEHRTHVTIGPLTLAAIHGVVKTRLQQPLTRPLLVRLHATCDGNPLYALQLVREIQSRGSEAPIDTIPVPDGLRRLIATQIRRLPPTTRSELLACAALSSPSVDVLDGAALVPAVEQEIVFVDDHGRITFGHPLYAAAVYGSTPSAHRRELHGRLALMVGDGEERARHLVLAADTASEPVARAAEEGAALSRTRGCWEAAAELLEHAARLTPPDRQGHAERRIIAAAQHHVHAGDRGRARALLEAALATPLDRALRADALRVLAEVSYNDDNFCAASRQYRNALDLADDPRLVVEILLGLSYVDAQMWDQLWDFPGAAVHAHRALALAEEISDAPLVAEALGYCAMCNFLCGRGIDWSKLERAVALEDPARVVPVERRPSTMAALLALYDGRHAEARNGLNGVRCAARLRGDESDLAFVLTWESWLETRAGSFDAARVLADEAASLATLTGSSSMHAWALTQHAYVRAHLGDVADTRRLCAEATSMLDSSGYLQPGTWIAASLTLLEISLGNTAAAWQACRPLVEALETHEPREPVIAFFLPDALEVLIELGELERAAALVQTFERRGHDLDRTWAVATGARCRGLLLAARGDLKRAATALEDADTHHGNLDMPFEHARTLLAKGRIERRARRRSHAHTSLQHALTLFEHTGATLWSNQARAELAHTHPRRTNGDELTVAERRIAEHAVRGHTNREIAAELFMSPKTVEAHITHIYRKLHIHTRAELGARLAAEG